MPEERRLVTVLFADVTGSTELGESLDPEDVRALLARFYAIAKDVVAAHGGTLEKFIGDAVMAVFGMPMAHGDDAERAISAALELRDRVRAEPKLAERLPVRLGVNTGEVVATRDAAAGDFLVTGDAVNVAARLQQTAEPWQVLGGERTVRAAGHAFAFGPLVEVAAKGKRAGVRAAPVLRRATARPARIPLIGRDSDLAQLELVARRAFGEQRPQLVSVIAPAGTGKTRLLEELLDRLPELAPAATVAIAQCLPYGQRLTYWPLRAVLFRLAGIPERAGPAEVRDAIGAWLEGSTVERPERVAELLAATIGVGDGEVTDRAALFAAWRSAFEHAARRAPLVVVFEDLHWSSDSLLELVEFVMQPRGDLPVLMVALTRPELLDRRPGWGGGRRNYVALALEPLSDDALAELIGHLLETSAPEIVSRVVARAEGNPFFAGELVRSLLDRVSSFDDPDQVERALASLPDTVQATVLARLDLLRPGERRVLQLGAVLGRTFRAGAIAALDPSLGDVGGVVDVLLEKDLVRQSAADVYVFRHILIREVAYQTLPRAERARLHAGAARWFEEFAAGREDAFAELIAYHYHEAASLAASLDVAETEVAEVHERATAWLVRAADVALAGAAQQESARHLRAAIELARPDQFSMLYEKLGDTYKLGEAADHYRTALRLFREQGGRDADRELRLLAGAIGVLMRSQGSVADRPSEEEMARLRAEGRSLLARASDERAMARFLTADSFYPFWRGLREQVTPEQLDDADSSGRRALEIVERLGDARMQSAALDGIGSIAMERGDLRGCREIARRRLPLRDRLDLTELIDAWSVIAWSSVILGDLDEAIRISTDGLAQIQPGQAPSWALHLASWRTLTLYLRGRWDEALASAERMLQLWNEGERIAAGPSLRGFEAGIAIARARRDEPRQERLRDAVQQIIGKFRDPGPITLVVGAAIEGRPADDHQLRRCAGGTLLMDLDRGLATRSDRAEPPSVDVLADLESAVAMMDGVLVKAQLERARGLRQQDARALTSARATFEGCGALPYAARARVEGALVSGDRAEYAAGLRLLEEIGDLEQIERYERRKRA